MKSCLYEGRVWHARTAPCAHAFRYRLFMAYLDLAELPTLFDRFWLWSARRPALAWFRRADYLGDARVPLDDAVRELVQARTGRRPQGPIRVLTHLRYFGHCFNPVTFYYVFDATDARVETLVAEITNTPWRERHAYVLPAPAEGALEWSFAKEFHVSPFMPIVQRYEWRFGMPATTLDVRMENHEAERVFTAGMRLRRVPITSGALARSLLRWPMVTVRVIAGIYWQALRLKLKGVPFFSHPGAARCSDEA
jgi:uncharacterized protein